MDLSALAPFGTTLLGLFLLGFFALLLCGGLVVVGGLGVIGYRLFRDRTRAATETTAGAHEPSGLLSTQSGCLASVLLGALLAFLGLLGLVGLGVIALLSTVTGAAGVARALREEPPATLVLEAPERPREPVRVVAEVRGPLDPELVQRLSDLATRRRALDLRVKSRAGASGDGDPTWLYEFTLPPIDPDPATLVEEMRVELEARGLAPVSLTTPR